MAETAGVQAVQMIFDKTKGKSFPGCNNVRQDRVGQRDLTCRRIIFNKK